MKVDVGIWDKLSRLVIFLLFIAGLLSVAVWYYPLIQTNERMRKTVLRLDQDIRHEEARARHFKAAIEALSKDPKTIERVARTELLYAKPDETVIRFEIPANPEETLNPSGGLGR